MPKNTMRNSVTYAAKKLDQESHFKKYADEYPEDQKRLYKTGRAYFVNMQ